MDEMDLARGVIAGDRLALARTLSHVENNTAVGRSALNALFPHTGKAHLVGVTGASGTGKSSLVNQLARHYRQPTEGQASCRVAVVAVDPTSPFTGGAILGDRIRMRDLAGDPGVFIRSMATRGSLGGIASTTGAVVQVLDAAGFELILVETVGAGQSEVDIARLAHTTIVVEAPGLGDDIQAIKAGILEIADVLVVNKADLPGVENTERALRGSLGLAHPTPHRFFHHGQLVTPAEQGDEDSSDPIWVPPILRTVALDGTGVAELAEAIAAHRAYLERTGGWLQRERGRLQTELDQLLQARLLADFRSRVKNGAYERLLEGVLERRIAPFQAVEELVDKYR
jgi:LAO/AO transport system kinase